MTPLYAIFDATHLGASLELEQSGTQLGDLLATFTSDTAAPASRPWL